MNTIRRYFIPNRDQHIHVTEWGKPDNPVIFCLHGLGSTGLSFIEVAHDLQEEFRIISIDAPGHGKTSPFTHAQHYEMENMADWLEEVVGILQLNSFYFLSHSWGSFAALFYAAKYPEKVKGCILIDGGYQGKRHSEQTVEDEVAYYEQDFEQVWETWEDFLALVQSETLHWSSMKLEAAKDLCLYQNQRYYWHARGETAAHFIRAMHKDEAEGIYHKVKAPVLLLRATLPVSMEAQRLKTAAIFKEKTLGEVKCIPGTTHLLHWDRPDVVVNEIKKRWK